MSIKSIAHILLIILITLLDVAFVSNLPFGLYRVHLVIIALVFVLLLENVRLASWWILIAGFIFEIFSFKHFGAYLISLTLVAGALYLFLEKVVTNRSLYAVGLLAAVGALLYDLALLVYNYLFEEVSIESFGQFVAGEFWGLAANAVVAVAVFYLSSAVNRRLKPVFLTR